jgi:anti-sigma regulatory factor (Ser/Thr protein kinase)
MTVAIEASRSGPGSIVCDLGALHDASPSHLLTVFPAAQRRIGAWPEHSIHLAGASPAVAHRLARLRIDRFMSVHRDVDAALAAAHAGQHAVHRDLELPASPDSPSSARDCVSRLLHRALTQRRDDALVVVSELTSNAVRHVRQPFRLDLALTATHLTVAVTDSSRQEPILRPTRRDAGDGRGVQLVNALSESWGVRLIHKNGKTVWSRISTAAA